jgi:hypothetical protein
MKVQNNREVYHELGTFDFKVLMPEPANCLKESSFKVLDSSGKYITAEHKRWGDKLRCIFKIDDDVSDGVAAAVIDVTTSEGKAFSTTVYFWVIKP